jgi:DNA-binding NarL/FixJ family response regulator
MTATDASILTDPAPWGDPDLAGNPGTIHLGPFPRRAGVRTEIRVMLVENVGLMRAGLHALLEGQTGVTVTGDAVGDDDAVAQAAASRPDVVVMDADLPGLDAAEVTRRILANPATANVRVLILSEHAEDERVFGVLRAGAAGYLLKRTDPFELVSAVRVVARGGGQLSPAIAQQVIAEFAAMATPTRVDSDRFSELTARQIEVLGLVATGQTNGEIAQRLVVTPATAKTHVSRIMVKLGAHSRAELVALTYQAGLAGNAVGSEGANDPAGQRELVGT